MSIMQILDLNISGIQCSLETDSSLQQVAESEMSHIFGGGDYKHGYDGYGYGKGYDGYGYGKGYDGYDGYDYGKGYDGYDYGKGYDGYDGYYGYYKDHSGSECYDKY